MGFLTEKMQVDSFLNMYTKRKRPQWLCYLMLQENFFKVLFMVISWLRAAVYWKPKLSVTHFLSCWKSWFVEVHWWPRRMAYYLCFSLSLVVKFFLIFANAGDSCFDIVGGVNRYLSDSKLEPPTWIPLSPWNDHVANILFSFQLVLYKWLAFHNQGPVSP